MRRCSVVWYIFQLAKKYLTISDTSWIGVRNATRTSSVGIGAKPDVGATIGGELKHATSGILRLIGGTSWCVLMRDCTFPAHLICILRHFFKNISWGYGATVARLTPDEKVGSSNLSALIIGYIANTTAARSLLWCACVPRGIRTRPHFSTNVQREGSNPCL